MHTTILGNYMQLVLGNKYFIFKKLFNLQLPYQTERGEHYSMPPTIATIHCHRFTLFPDVGDNQWTKKHQFPLDGVHVYIN